MKINVQYPESAELDAERTLDGYTFTLDGRRFFEVTSTDRGVRVDSEATMGKRRYYYGKQVTLRFSRDHRPIVTSKGHPTKPLGYSEEDFEA